jgi:hypothetical protein
VKIDFFDYSLHPMIGMRLKIQSLTHAAKSVAIFSIVSTGAYVYDATADVLYEKYDETGAMTIKVSGVIAEDDFKKLDVALDSLTRSHLKLHMNSVELDSNGGNRSAGMIMGYTIRRYGLNTIVKPDAICHSACVYALIGGIQRYPFGEIGVHRTTFEEAPKTDKNIELIVKKISSA